MFQGGTYPFLPEKQNLLRGFPLEIPTVNLVVLKPPRPIIAIRTPENSSSLPNFELLAMNNCSLTLYLDADGSLHNHNRLTSHAMASLNFPATFADMEPFVPFHSPQNINQYQN